MTTEALRHRKNSTESAAPLSWNASSIKYRIARAMCYGSMVNECLITTPAAVELGKQNIQSRLSFVCQLVYNSAHLIFFHIIKHPIFMATFFNNIHCSGIYLLKYIRICVYWTVCTEPCVHSTSNKNAWNQVIDQKHEAQFPFSVESPFPQKSLYLLKLKKKTNIYLFISLDRQITNFSYIFVYNVSICQVTIQPNRCNKKLVT